MRLIRQPRLVWFIILIAVMLSLLFAGSHQASYMSDGGSTKKLTEREGLQRPIKSAFITADGEDMQTKDLASPWRDGAKTDPLNTGTKRGLDTLHDLGRDSHPDTAQAYAWLTNAPGHDAELGHLSSNARQDTNKNTTQNSKYASSFLNILSGQERDQSLTTKAHATGTTVHNVTFTELNGLIAQNNLVVGDKYRLTDFRTRYTIPNTIDTHAGNIEVLVLTANSPNRLDMLAVSEDYPEDIILYTVSNKVLFYNDPAIGYSPDPAVDRGYIMYRKDTLRNVEVGEDFRNMVYRRWETAAGNGVYAHFAPWHAPEGAGYRDFPMFADYNATSEVHIDHHRGNGGGPSEDGNYLSNTVFMDRAYKVEILDGAQNGTFMGSVIELSMKFCSKGTFYGDIERAVFGTSSEMTVTGELYSVYINKAEMMLDGNFSNIEVLANYAEDAIIGDYSHKVFGTETEKTFNLIPDGEHSLGGNKDNPYVLGSNSETRLVVDTINLQGPAFIVVNPSSPPSQIEIMAKGTTYVAFDGVPYSGNAWALANFNDHEGWKIEADKTMMMNGATGTWSTDSQNSVYATIIGWKGGADAMDGYEQRYSLNAEQYGAAEQAFYDPIDHIVNFSSGLRVNTDNVETNAPSYGGYFQNLVANSATDDLDKYGLYIDSSGSFLGGDGIDTNNYGLFVDTPTGADNNYAAVFAGGEVGVGTDNPDYTLDVSGDLRIEGGHNWYFGGTGLADNDVNLYRNSADQLKTDDQLIAGDGVANKVNAGPCNDAIFTLDTDGLTCIDSTNGRLYFRSGGEWHYTAQADGFQIPNNQAYRFDLSTNDFDTQLPLSVGDFLVPFAKEKLKDGAIHGLYAKWSDVKNIIMQEENSKLDALTIKLDFIYDSLLTLNEIEYFKELLGVSRVSNSADVNISGEFSSAATETGALALRTLNEGEKRIGQAVICPVAFEVDEQGDCTVFQNDLDGDGLDDVSGNPMSNGRGVIIKTHAVSEQSRIFLTPRTLIESPLAVTEIENGLSFKVEVINTIPDKILFDWFIVEDR